MAAKGKAAEAVQVQTAVCSTALIAYRHKDEGLTGSKYHRGLPPYEEWDDCEWYHKPSREDLGKTLWQYVWCGGFDLDEKGERKYHHFEKTPCTCPPGPQFRALYVRAKEIALIGARGSSKSETALPFLVKGDYALPDDSPYKASYINCPKYKFLILRKNSKDLADFFDRARQFFEPIGGRCTSSPMEVRFPSGAWGFFDHVDNEQSFTKYQGVELTKIVWEEVNQCPSEELFLKIRMSLRSPVPELYEQMMLTMNPGGPGHKWTRARYLTLTDEKGEKIKSGQLYTEPFTGRTRCFIHSKVEDNPYNMRKGYDKDLDELKKTNPTLYAQWRHGDYDVVEGAYFEHFREERRPNEPPAACHVLKCTKERPEPIRLAPWWPRAIGVDWGYAHKTVALWGCWRPNQQMHVYREMAVSRTGTVEIGAELAKRSLVDLEAMPSQHMMVHLSHDAFHRTDDDLTEAEQIARGINMVLGHEAAFVYAPNQDEESMPDAWTAVRRRQKELERKTALTLVPAGGAGKRKPGWNLLREYMRWWPLLDNRFDEERAKEILLQKGMLAYSEYKRRCEIAAGETLPKIIFWSCCEGIISGIQAAQESENDPEDVLKQNGDDHIDSLNYLVSGFKFNAVEAPRDVQIGEKLSRLKETVPGIDTHALIRAANVAEWEYDRAHSGGAAFNIPRSVGPTRRRHERVH